MKKILLPSGLILVTAATALANDYTRVVEDRGNEVVIEGKLDNETLLQSISEDDFPYMRKYIWQTRHEIWNPNWNKPSVDDVARHIRWKYDDPNTGIYRWQVCTGKKPEPPVKPPVRPSQPSIIKKPVVIKEPVVVPGDTLRQPIVVPGDTIRQPIVVPGDTIRNHIVITDTLKDTVVTIPKIKKPNERNGLYDVDKWALSIGSFYRKDNGELVGINPKLAFHSFDKGVRVKGDLDLIVLNTPEFREEDWNTIGKGLIGFYNKYLGGGFEVDKDNGDKVYLYPYAEGALTLDRVILAGKGGVGFNLDVDEFDLRHSMEGLINYKNSNGNFGFDAYAQSKHDNLLNRYMNSAGLDFKFGNLIIGISGKTPYGIEIANIEVLEALKSIEGKFKIGSEFGNFPKFRLIGYVSGKHNDEEGRYEAVEGGIEFGIDYDFSSDGF